MFMYYFRLSQMLRNKRIKPDKENRSPTIQRDTPDAKRQKRDKNCPNSTPKRDAYCSTSTPKRMTVKMEPLDWEKACSSVSPSKILRDESQEPRLITTPPNGKDTRTTPEIHIKRDIFGSPRQEESEVEEGEVTGQNLAPEPTQQNTSHRNFYSDEVYQPNRNAFFFGNPSNQQNRNAMPQVLCFRCKGYGHTRVFCKNKRNYQWPEWYSKRNPWINDRLTALRIQRGRNRIGGKELARAHMDIEAEAVKRIREKSQRILSQYGHWDRTSTNEAVPMRPSLLGFHRPPSQPPNRFEQPFPKVHRRLHGPGNTSGSSSIVNSSKSNSPDEAPVLVLTSSPNKFNFLELVSAMQKQIEELQESCKRLHLQQF